ncbi:hypothetical protein GCM10009628_10120 [Paeniglutamicibacter kerguelensis]
MRVDEFDGRLARGQLGVAASVAGRQPRTEAPPVDGMPRPVPLRQLPPAGVDGVEERPAGLRRKVRVGGVPLSGSSRVLPGLGKNSLTFRRALLSGPVRILNRTTWRLVGVG